MHVKIASDSSDRKQADPEARDPIAKFDNVQFDMWSRDMIVTPEGTRLAVRHRVRQLAVNYVPCIVLFGGTGREIIRWESSFRVFHTLSMFDYVSSGAYIAEPVSAAPQ